MSVCMYIGMHVWLRSVSVYIHEIGGINTYNAALFAKFLYVYIYIEIDR